MDSANKSCVANSSQKKVKEGRLYCEKLEPAAIDEIKELIGLDGRNQSDTDKAEPYQCPIGSLFKREPPDSAPEESSLDNAELDPDTNLHPEVQLHEMDAASYHDYNGPSVRKNGIFHSRLSNGTDGLDRSVHPSLSRSAAAQMLLRRYKRRKFILPKHRSPYLSRAIHSDSPSDSSNTAYTTDDIMRYLLELNCKVDRIISNQENVFRRLNEIDNCISNLIEVSQDTNFVLSATTAAENSDFVPEEDLESPPMEHILMGPASTLEELDAMVEHPGLIEMLKRCEEPTLKATVRSMLKAIATRDLIIQFTYTGLGTKRQRNRFCLKDHKLHQIILQALSQTVHFRKGPKEIGQNLMSVLKNAKDWDGYRRERRLRAQHRDTFEANELIEGHQ